MSIEKVKPQFQISRLEGESFTNLSDTDAGKARLAKAAADITFLGRTTETVANYDKKTREFKPATTLTLARYERNVKAAAGREDDHHAEVIRVLHAETADVIQVIDSKTGGVTQYPKEYLKTAYEVIVLGKFRKGAPEVEALIAETDSTTVK